MAGVISAMKLELIFVATAAMATSACSTSRIGESASIYEGVAKQLVEARYTSACCGYVGYWRPLGEAHLGGISSASEELTAEQQQELQAGLATCIEKLKREYIGVNESIATSQLIECMRAKGWSHGFEEFVTTS
jgi:hypothetical protein